MNPAIVVAGAALLAAGAVAAPASGGPWRVPAGSALFPGDSAGERAPTRADTVELVRAPRRLLVGQRVRMRARVVEADGQTRVDAPITWRATSSSYVSLSPDGRVTGIRPGTVDILASHGDDVATFTVEVLPNRLASLAIWPSYATTRTGDPVVLDLDVRDRNGAEIPGLLAEWEVTPEGARVGHDGRFVAERFGLYTVLVQIGDRKAVATIRVAPDL